MANIQSFKGLNPPRDPSSPGGTAALLQAAGRCLFAVVFPCRAAALLQVAAARLSAAIFPWLAAALLPAAAARLSAAVFPWLRAGGLFLWMKPA